ncbi:MAG: UMP kinase [Clostridia bacterium]|nr:UMP kinase [Clostridia bacterium]
MDRKYKRVVLKLSGEALAGDDNFVLCPEILKRVAKQIAQIASAGVQVGVVIGAGNIWRGRMDEEMNRAIADNMGMAATLINSLAMKDYVIRAGVDAEVLSAVAVDKFADYYTTRRAIDLLEKNVVVIFACGTGNPFFTTDTAGALRACEISADGFIQAKNIDAVYDDDPRKNPKAKPYKRINYNYILKNELKAFDATASILLRDNNIDCIMVSLNDEDALLNALNGRGKGTIICNDDVVEYY